MPNRSFLQRPVRVAVLGAVWLLLSVVASPAANVAGVLPPAAAVEPWRTSAGDDVRWAAPGYGDDKVQIPHGKYWKVLQRYIVAISKSGVKPDRAQEAAFVDESGRPLDLGSLEKEWQDYVLAYPEMAAPIQKK